MLRAPILGVAFVLAFACNSRHEEESGTTVEDGTDDVSYEDGDVGRLEICLDVQVGDDAYEFPTPIREAMVVGVGTSTIPPCEGGSFVIRSREGLVLETSVRVDGWEAERVPGPKLHAGEFIDYVPVSDGRLEDWNGSFAIVKRQSLDFIAIAGRSEADSRAILAEYGVSVALGEPTGTGEPTWCGHRLHSALTVDAGAETLTLFPGDSKNLGESGLTATLVSAYRIVGCERASHQTPDGVELVLVHTGEE